MDSSLEKYLGKKTKDLNISEAAEEVASMRRIFHEKSISYSLELDDFRYRKKAEFFENVYFLLKDFVKS